MTMFGPTHARQGGLQLQRCTALLCFCPQCEPGVSCTLKKKNTVLEGRVTVLTSIYDYLIKREEKKFKMSLQKISSRRLNFNSKNILGKLAIRSDQTDLCNLYKGVVDGLLQRRELLLSSLDLLLQPPALLLKSEQLLPCLDQLLLELTYPLLLILVLRL